MVARRTALLRTNANYLQLGLQAENSGTSSKSARGQFWMAGEETKPLSETLAHRSEHSSKRRRVDGGGEGSPDNDRQAFCLAAPEAGLTTVGV